MKLYKEFAWYYDLIYKNKKYQAEVQFIDSVLKKYQVKGKKILDVACGSGNHAKILIKKRYDVVGIDKNIEMLKIAQKKVPKAYFKVADMKSFSLKRKFDIILCMFTSIHYNLTKGDLLKTILNFKKHLNDNGLIIIDSPIFKKGVNKKKAYHLQTKEGDVLVHYHFVDQGKGKLKITIYWKIASGKKYKVLKDIHYLQAYTVKEFVDTFRKAGLKYKVYWDFSIRKKKGHRYIFVLQK